MESKVVERDGTEKTSGGIGKDAFVLFVITLIAAVLLGLVYEVTKGPIAEQKQKAKTEAYRTVFQGLSRTAEDEALTERALASAAFLQTIAGKDYSGIQIDEVLLAYDASDAFVGYVLSVTTNNAYDGSMTLSMGYTTDGTVTGIAFLDIHETAGLGMNAKEESFRGQFTNQQVADFGLYKGAAAVIEGEGHIDSISGATITSRAVTNAVNAGISFAADLLAAGLGGDAQ